MLHRQLLWILVIIAWPTMSIVQAQWVNQPSDTLLLSYDTVFMLDGQTGWIGGNYGSILKTTDGGGSWKILRVTSSTFVNVSEIRFVDKSTGFCLASTISTAFLLTKSDGGT